MDLFFDKDNNYGTTMKFHLDVYNCKNIIDIIERYDKYIMDNHKILGENMTIILATIREQYNTKQLQRKNVIFKISPNFNLLENDFKINSVIKNIDGFIKYICKFTCFDDTRHKIIKKIKDKTSLEDYEIERGLIGNENVQNYEVSPICTSKKPVDNKMIIVMPYVPNKTIRQTKWNLKKLPILQSLLQQTIIAYKLAFLQHKFIHVDSHLDNIMYIKTTKKQINGITTYGYKTVIIDFDKSILNGSNIDLYLSIKKLFTDLNRLNIPIKMHKIYKILDKYNNINAIKMIDMLINVINKLEIIPLG